MQQQFITGIGETISPKYLTNGVSLFSRFFFIERQFAKAKAGIFP
jgi:hypothetical protein